MNYIKKIFIFTLFLNFTNVNAVDEKFHVCGSYCGPNWCNNMWLPEDHCDTSVEPEYHNLTGYSCADVCCKHHDNCCGKNIDNKKFCNKKIVECLKKCDPLSLTCTLDYIPIPKDTIEIAMDIIEDWCCGTPC